ncbi:unnamed protein product, partial [Ectocarpus fasciculatus]
GGWCSRTAAATLPPDWPPGSPATHLQAAPAVQPPGPRGQQRRLRTVCRGRRSARRRLGLRQGKYQHPRRTHHRRSGRHQGHVEGASCKRSSGGGGGGERRRGCGGRWQG